MAYPYTYPNYNNYSGNYNPYQNQTNNNQQNSGIIWVQGEAGARAYLVAPNSTVQLWDSEAQIIYLKSADASGMPTIKILDYTIRENESRNVSVSEKIEKKIEQNGDFATKKDISALKSEIKEIKAQIKPQRKTIKKGENDE